MRLMMVSQDFPPAVGGVQSYSLELAKRLAKRAEQLRCVAPRIEGCASFDCTSPIETTRVLGNSDALAITGLFAVPSIARELRPDVAFHAQWQTSAASLWSRARSGFPRRIVVATHGRELRLDPLRRVPGGHKAFSAMRGAILRSVDAVLSVSRYTAGLVREVGVDPRRIHVVCNGVDAHRFHPVDPSAFVRRHGLSSRRRILTIGRLVRRKGIDTVIEALPRIIDAFGDVSYVVAGDGPDGARLKDLALRLGVGAYVRFIGRVPQEDLCACYSSADVFVTVARDEPPSVEGFGLVFLEAGACGVPVVGSRSGGIEDAIVEGVTGHLVQPSDPDAVARVVLSLLRDPKRARQMGDAARQRALTEASWDRAAEATFSILSACTTTRKGCR